MFLCGWRIIEVIGNFCSSRANRARSLPLSRPKIFSFQKINWTVQYLFSVRWLLSITQSFHIFIFGWVLGDDLWLENTRTMIYGDKSHESWVRHNSWLWQITRIVTTTGSDKSRESWKSFPGSCIAWSHSSAGDTFQGKAKPGKAVLTKSTSLMDSPTVPIAELLAKVLQPC